MPLKVIAHMHASEGKTDHLKHHMKALIEATRQEHGCLQYDLFQSTKAPNLLVFIEEWESHAHWQTHMKGSALSAFNNAIGSGNFDSVEIHQLTQIA